MKDNNNNEILYSDIDWTNRPLLGLSLTNMEEDSFGESIKSHYYYNVGKHIPTGLIVIIPLNDVFNSPICLN